MSADCPSPTSDINKINLNVPELACVNPLGLGPAGALASSPVQSETEQDLTGMSVEAPASSSGYVNVVEGTTVPSLVNFCQPVEATGQCLSPTPPEDVVAAPPAPDVAFSPLSDPDFDPDCFPPPPP